MTINTTDIKLLESERMSDASDGGGRRTSRVIVDGAPSNIFPKVSRLDSVYGRVNLRKVYGAVVTANLDTYAGAHAVIMDRPDNDRIHTNLFSTGSDYDTRAAARDRIESYVISGPESRMVLYGRQLVGQQALLAYQRPEEPLPEIGEVYCLSKEVNKAVVYQQFVRITDLTHEVRIFVDGAGDFQARVISMTIGAPLRYQFDGPETPARVSSVARESLLRATTVADAARYYGVQKLVEPAAAGALSLRLESVYSPIVPTTQRETPIALGSINGAVPFIASGAITSAASFTMSFYINRATRGNPYAIRLPTAFRPGTLAGDITINGLINGTWAFTDLGDGTFECRKDGVIDTGVAIVADYESGTLYLESDLSNNSRRWILTLKNGQLGVYAGQPARTRAIEVTLGTRGTVYSEVLNPLPAPGSTIVDYRSLGKWYRLRDDGTGELAGGDPAYGAGTVDFASGALIVTLGALPDVDSSVLISWGSPIDYEVRAGATADNDSAFLQTFTLEHVPIQPGTLGLSFISDRWPPYETVCAANDAAGTGAITGSGVDGFVNYTTGEVRLRFTTYIPNAASILTVNYRKAEMEGGGASVVQSGTFSIPGQTTLPQSPIAISSFVLVVPITYRTSGGWDRFFSAELKITDDGFGKLFVRKGQLLPVNEWGWRSTTGEDTEVGTINYVTGEIVVNDTPIKIAAMGYSVAGAYYVSTPLEGLMSAGPGAFTYRVGGSIAEQLQRTDEISLTDSPLAIDLTKTTATPIVPGSVLFNIRAADAGETRAYIERNGTIYTEHEEGYFAPCGSIDYETGIATISSRYSEGSPSYTITVLSCLTQIGDFSAVGAFFRTAGSPIRPASFYVQAAALSGDLLSGTTDQNGVITGAKVRGQVVQEMGVARVEFGEMRVPEGGSVSEWTPIEIAPNTLRYSAVVLSNLPLNADILGLDPVRLPSDGRVPIYRPADVVLIHNTKTLELENPAQAGGTYSMGRASLSDLWLTDADGAKVPTSKYTVSLGAGTVTMAADLDLTGIQQPLTAHHRIEEMQLLSDVQINGTIGLTSTLGRDFDADSYVSSALLFGDLNARYANLFDQASWTSVWSDTLIGNSATAQYNDIDYPIEVLNDGAVTDRWRLNFTTGNPSTGTASFQVISENLGVIANGNTGADCAPVNALTGKPYFVIRAGGWGIGWSVGNQVRFNTVAAAASIWIARTVLPGATLRGDSFDLQLRGDVDA